MQRRSGSLQKLRGVSWTKRYYVLDGDLLLCYKHQDDTQPQSIRQLKCMRHVAIQGERDFALVSWSNNKKYWMRAESGEDRGHWVAAIQRVITAPAEADQASKTILNVTIAGARQLKCRSDGSMCNPWALVSLGGTTSKTIVANRTTEPVWKHQLMIVLTDIHDPTLSLFVQLWDKTGHSSFAADKFLGQVRINLAESYERQQLHPTTMHWYVLHKRNRAEEVCGDVCVSLEFTKYVNNAPNDAADEKSDVKVVRVNSLGAAKPQISGLLVSKEDGKQVLPPSGLQERLLLISTASIPAVLDMSQVCASPNSKAGIQISLDVNRHAIKPAFFAALLCTKLPLYYHDAMGVECGVLAEMASFDRMEAEQLESKLQQQDVLLTTAFIVSLQRYSFLYHEIRPQISQFKDFKSYEIFKAKESQKHTKEFELLSKGCTDGFSFGILNISEIHLCQLSSSQIDNFIYVSLSLDKGTNSYDHIGDTFKVQLTKENDEELLWTDCDLTSDISVHLASTLNVTVYSEKKVFKNRVIGTLRISVVDLLMQLSYPETQGEQTTITWIPMCTHVQGGNPSLIKLTASFTCGLESGYISEVVNHCQFLREDVSVIFDNMLASFLSDAKQIQGNGFGILSRWAKSFMREFAARFAVGTHHCRLAFLKYLLKIYQSDSTLPMTLLQRALERVTAIDDDDGDGDAKDPNEKDVQLLQETKQLGVEVAKMFLSNYYEHREHFNLLLILSKWADLSSMTIDEQLLQGVSILVKTTKKNVVDSSASEGITDAETLMAFIQGVQYHLEQDMNYLSSSSHPIAFRVMTRMWFLLQDEIIAYFSRKSLKLSDHFCFLVAYKNIREVALRMEIPVIPTDKFLTVMTPLIEAFFWKIRSSLCEVAVESVHLDAVCEDIQIDESPFHSSVTTFFSTCASALSLIKRLELPSESVLEWTTGAITAAVQQYISEVLQKSIENFHKKCEIGHDEPLVDYQICVAINTLDRAIDNLKMLRLQLESDLVKSDTELASSISSMLDACSNDVGISLQILSQKVWEAVDDHVFSRMLDEALAEPFRGGEIQDRWMRVAEELQFYVNILRRFIPNASLHELLVEMFEMLGSKLCRVSCSSATTDAQVEAIAQLWQNQDLKLVYGRMVSEDAWNTILQPVMQLFEISKKPYNDISSLYVSTVKSKPSNCSPCDATSPSPDITGDNILMLLSRRLSEIEAQQLLQREGVESIRLWHRCDLPRNEQILQTFPCRDQFFRKAVLYLTPQFLILDLPLVQKKTFSVESLLMVTNGCILPLEKIEKITKICNNDAEDSIYVGGMSIHAALMQMFLYQVCDVSKVMKAIKSQAKRLSVPHKIMLSTPSPLFSIKISLQSLSNLNGNFIKDPSSLRILVQLGPETWKSSKSTSTATIDNNNNNNNNNNVQAAILNESCVLAVDKIRRSLRISLLCTSRLGGESRIAEGKIQDLNRLEHVASQRKESVDLISKDNTKVAVLAINLENYNTSDHQKEEIVVLEVFENQRRSLLSDKFSSGNLQPGIDPPAWSNNTNGPVDIQIDDSWNVDNVGTEDSEGWQYAWNFPKGHHRTMFLQCSWKCSSRSKFDFVRRRRWIKHAEEETSLPPTPLQQITSVDSNSSLAVISMNDSGGFYAAGWILKSRSNGFFAMFGMKRRWVVIKDEHLYLHREPMKLAKYRLALRRCTVRQCGIHDVFHGLEIADMNGKLWFLWAESSSDQRRWMDALMHAGATKKVYL